MTSIGSGCGGMVGKDGGGGRLRVRNLGFRSQYLGSWEERPDTVVYGTGWYTQVKYDAVLKGIGDEIWERFDAERG